VVKSLQAANLGDDANTTPAICGQSVPIMEKQEFL
jgi:hypothetical protein